MYIRLFAICLSFVIAGQSIASAEIKDPAEEELYQKCKSAYMEGKFAEASQNVNSFLSLYPKSDYAGEMLFMQAFLQPDINTSIEIYNRIADKYPNSVWAGKSHFQLGQCYYIQGRYDKALEHYGKVVVYFMESEVYWQARYWWCKSLLARSDYDSAIRALESLKNKKEISNDAVLMSLAECHFGKKEYEKAEALYRSLIESMPDSQWIPSAYISLAKSLQSLGRSEEAKALYQKVIENYKQSVEAVQAKKHLDSSQQVRKETVQALEKLEQKGTRDFVPRKVESQLESSFLKTSDGNVKSQQPVNIQAQPSSQSGASAPSVQIKWKDMIEETEEDVKEKETYFTIQVGAFSKKSSAESLAKQLKKRGYSASVFPPSSGEKPKLYKVRVGTFKTEDDARKEARRLSKNENLDAGVVPMTK